MKKEYLCNALPILFHALNYKITKRRVPLMVSLGLTDRCNLSCPFCYAKNTGPKCRDYTTAELLDAVEQFVKLGTRIFLLQGGEPLLRKDLKEVIAHIKRKGRYCRLSTNGLLVAERIDDLTGLDEISFSLDGNEEVVDKIRGQGVYKKVIAGMEAAYARKIPFEIHASLVRESAMNRDSVRHLLQLARKYKTQVSFCITSVSGAHNTQNLGSADLTSAEIREFFDFLIRLKKEKYPVSNTFNSLRKSRNWPIHYAQIGFRHNLPAGFRFSECRHGRLICWLDANYTMYPCPITFLRPEYAVTVEDGNMGQAWHRLGEKVNCVACGSSDESTTFFALKLEDLKNAFLKTFIR